MGAHEKLVPGELLAVSSENIELLERKYNEYLINTNEEINYV